MKQKMTLSERIGSIKSAFTGLPPQSNLQNLAQSFTPIYGEPPRRSTAQWIKLYNENPRMNPVHQIASDVATSAYGLYQKDDTKKQKIKNSPVDLLLKNPNSNLTMTEYVLFYITQVYLLLPSGEAFWLLEKNGLGKVTEIWPVPPNWVLHIPSVSVPYFSIYPQGNVQVPPIYVLPEDIIYFKKPDVSNPYLRGIGRANGIADEIETDEFMAKYAKRFFFNDAVPNMVIQMPGADEPTVNRAEEGWNAKFGGYNNSHRTAFVNWELKAQLLKETNKDMDFIESRKYLRDVSNQHFNIPPELMGILENSNRSTIDAAYFLYTKNVLRKELKFIDDTLNRQLVPKFTTDQFLEHDNVVPEDAEFELKKSTEGLKFGALSVNQWLRTNGFEEIGEKGEVIYVPINMIPVSLKSDTLPTNLPAREPPAEPPPKGITKDLSAELKNVKKVIKSLTKKERSELGPRYFYDDSQYRYIEFAEEEPIAFIENRSTGKKGHLNIAVHLDHRKSGIAKRIVGDAIKVLEETGLEKIFWITTTNNASSISLAKKCGFEFLDEDDDGGPRYVYYFPEEKRAKKKTLTIDHKNRIWLILDKAAQKNERPFINALKRYFQAQQDKINKALEKSVKAATDDPDELLDWTKEDVLLLAALKPLWIASLTEALNVANDTFGFGISFDVMNPKFLDWVREFGLDRAKGINSTTKDALKKTLSEGIDAGESIPKLRDRIGLVYGDAKGYRATLIARTETATTVNAGALDSYRAGGITQKEWLSTKDNRTRVEHADIDGEVVDIDKPFSNGFQHPQEPNCRCTILPVLPED
ncbi:MAG: phage portal protein [Sediminibacterium sp.]